LSLRISQMWMKRRVLLIIQDQLNVNEQPICFVVDNQSNVNK
jgi:hypothetical protein